MPSMGGSFSWDDYTIFLCLLGLVPATALGQLMVNNGLGQDIWMLTPDEITNLLRVRMPAICPGSCEGTN